MANEEEVKQEIFYIPDNYEDAGGVLGGHFSQRNAIELCVLCGPLTFLEYKLLHFNVQTNIIIMMVTLIPLAAVCAFGIGGESLSQIALAFIRYVRKKRKLSYIEFTDPKAVETRKGPWNIDSLLDSISSKGLKNAIKSAREQVTAEKTEATLEGLVASEDGKEGAQESVKTGYKMNTHRTPEHAPHQASNQQHSKSKPKKKGTQSGLLLNSALREKLLQKLEFGDEDDGE